jgi:murein DD-endopeptidase / murein LD-carboxypeptidase
MQFFTGLLIIEGLFFFGGCKPPRMINTSVVTSKYSVIPSAVTDTIAVEPLKQYDSLQIEFGDKLGVSYDSISNLRLYRYIRENLDKKCNNNKKEGYSCESFLPTLFKNVYSFDLPGTIAAQLQYKGLELYRDTSYLREGDIVFFSYSEKQPERISHNGFYLRNGYFLTATYSKGIIITRLDKEFWAKKIYAAGRIKNR